MIIITLQTAYYTVTLTITLTRTCKCSRHLADTLAVIVTVQLQINC